MSPAPLPLSERGPAASFKLIVAGHFVYTGRVGGAEQMLYNLLRGLGALGTQTELLCAARTNLSAEFRSELATMPSMHITETGGGGPRFLAEQRACLQRDLRGDAILFPNYYLPPLTPKRLGRTGIVLHDLQYRHFPAYFSAKKRAWLHAAQAFATRRADRVIVISEFVRDDVLRVYGERLAHKLAVAPNPISWSRFEADGATDRPIGQPYILSVAAQYPHKNLATLIRAFAEVARHDRDVQLVLCGQDYAGLHGVGGERVGLKSLIGQLDLAGRIRLTGYLDDASLGRWYKHAALFAFPSVFEGFGMPPVEALGFGLPVLTTDRTALPETTLGLARTVSAAEDAGEWAAHILDMLRQGDAARLTEAQVARVRHTYSPVVCAQRYIEALGG